MMDYIQGTNLEILRMLNQLKPMEKDAIVNNIMTTLTQLRSLHSSKEGVVTYTQDGAILDYHIDSHLVGSFESHVSFHSFLRDDISIENTVKMLGEEVGSCHHNNYRTLSRMRI